MASKPTRISVITELLTSQELSPLKSKAMLRVLELSWLVIVLLGAGLGTFKLITENITSAVWFFLITLVALVFYVVRRRQRIRVQKKSGLTIHS